MKLQQDQKILSEIGKVKALAYLAKSVVKNMHPRAIKNQLTAAHHVAAGSMNTPAVRSALKHRLGQTRAVLTLAGKKPQKGQAMKLATGREKLNEEQLLEFVGHPEEAAIRDAVKEHLPQGHHIHGFVQASPGYVVVKASHAHYRDQFHYHHMAKTIGGGWRHLFQTTHGPHTHRVHHSAHDPAMAEGAVLTGLKMASKGAAKATGKFIKKHGTVLGVGLVGGVAAEHGAQKRLDKLAAEKGVITRKKHERAMQKESHYVRDTAVGGLIGGLANKVGGGTFKGGAIPSAALSLGISALQTHFDKKRMAKVRAAKELHARTNDEFKSIGEGVLNEWPAKGVAMDKEKHYKDVHKSNFENKFPKTKKSKDGKLTLHRHIKSDGSVVYVHIPEEVLHELSPTTLFSYVKKAEPAFRRVATPQRAMGIKRALVKGIKKPTVTTEGLGSSIASGARKVGAAISANKVPIAVSLGSDAVLSAGAGTIGYFHGKRQQQKQQQPQANTQTNEDVISEKSGKPHLAHNVGFKTKAIYTGIGAAIGGAVGMHKGRGLVGTTLGALGGAALGAYQNSKSGRMARYKANRFNDSIREEEALTELSTTRLVGYLHDAIKDAGRRAKSGAAGMHSHKFKMRDRGIRRARVRLDPDLKEKSPFLSLRKESVITYANHKFKEARKKLDYAAAHPLKTAGHMATKPLRDIWQAQKLAMKTAAVGATGLGSYALTTAVINSETERTGNALHEGFAMDAYKKIDQYKGLGYRVHDISVDDKKAHFTVTDKEGNIRKHKYDSSGKRSIENLGSTKKEAEVDDEGNVVKAKRGRPKKDKFA